jgi:hypothetical protein
MPKARDEGAQTSIEYITLVSASLMLMSILAYSAYSNVGQSRQNLFLSYAKINLQKIMETAKMLWSSGSVGDAVTISLFYYSVEGFGDVFLVTDSGGDNLYYKLGAMSTENSLKVTMPRSVRIRSTGAQGTTADTIRLFGGTLHLKLTKMGDHVLLENVRWG